MTYSISEAARRMGVAPSTLRYYDKEGLLPHIRRENGRRVFDDTDLRWLTLLNCLKNTGMPLKRMKEYVELTKSGDATLPARAALIREQRAFVQGQIDQMEFFLAELDFKEWYYKKALAQGTEEGITLEAYEEETGAMTPERTVLQDLKK